MMDCNLWTTHHDVTCQAEEIVSHIFNGNDGLAAVDELTALAEKNNWHCGYTCGYHLHIDLSSEEYDSLRSVALAYQTSYEAWSLCVDSARLNYSYCRHKENSCADIVQIRDYDGWCRYLRGAERYSWVNWEAYAKYNTCEIRIHQGTCDGEQVRNWIRAHTVFVEWAVRVGFNVVRAALWCRSDYEKCTCLERIWEDAGQYDLVDFYNLSKHVATREENNLAARAW